MSLAERIRANGLYKAAFDITAITPSEKLDKEMAMGAVDVIALGTALASSSPKINPLTVIYAADLGRHVIKATAIALNSRKSKQG